MFVAIQFSCVCDPARTLLNFALLSLMGTVGVVSIKGENKAISSTR